MLTAAADSPPTSTRATLRAWGRAPRSALAAVELFAFGNLAFLAVDVYIAHSANSFAHSAEWIPVVVSLAAPVVLLVAMYCGGGVCPPSSAAGPLTRRQRVARFCGASVGVAAILTGVAGLLWHLDSQFFGEATLKSLVYTAPFVAPLAYAGVGFLILLNRMLDARAAEWGLWVLILAGCGFLGNFVLSLADHAQNGFFDVREWIPVAASAVAVGILAAVIFVDRSAPALRFTAWVMVGQIVVGVLGGYYHLQAVAASSMDSLWDKVVYGAPVFAPLLFANLAILALIGLWSLSLRLAEDAAELAAIP